MGDLPKATNGPEPVWFKGYDQLQDDVFLGGGDRPRHVFITVSTSNVARAQSRDGQPITTDTVVHVFMYGMVSRRRVQALSTTMERIWKQTGSNNPVILHISSLGGDLMETVPLRSLLHRYRLCVVVDGISASAASVLSMLAPYRVMVEGSFSLVHEFTYRLPSPNMRRGSLMADIDHTVGVMDELRKAYLTRCQGLTPEVLDDLLVSDRLLSSSTCMRLGMCDRVIRPRRAERARPDAGFMGVINDGRFHSVWLPSSAYVPNDEPEDNTQLAGPGGAIDYNSMLVNLNQLLLLDGKKDVVLYLSSRLDYARSTLSTATMTSRLLLVRSRTVAVMESADIWLPGLMVALACDHRAMHVSAKVVLRIDPSTLPSHRPEDLQANTETVLGELAEYLGSRCGITEELLRRSTAEYVILDSEECLKRGVAHELFGA